MTRLSNILWELTFADASFRKILRNKLSRIGQKSAKVRNFLLAKVSSSNVLQISACVSDFAGSNIIT